MLDEHLRAPGTIVPSWSAVFWPLAGAELFSKKRCIHNYIYMYTSIILILFIFDYNDIIYIYIIWDYICCAAIIIEMWFRAIFIRRAETGGTHSPCG